MAITAPLGVETLRWEVGAQEKGSPVNDQLKITQKVLSVVPIKTYQATIAQIAKDFHLSIESPEACSPGAAVGSSVTFRPKITNGLSGVNDYMKNYPYGCMEQKISMAIALRDEKQWEGSMLSFLPISTLTGW